VAVDCNQNIEVFAKKYRTDYITFLKDIILLNNLPNLKFNYLFSLGKL
jgi:hypothetical protein